MEKLDMCLQMLKQADDFRSALVERWPWFIHRTPARNLDTIRASGLIMHPNPGCPPGVIAAFGDNANNILCLHPLGANLVPSGTHSGDHVALAIASSHLPSPVSLDWTYAWEIVCSRWENQPGKSFVEFACDIAADLGSIASYGSIRPHDLRLQALGCPDNPARWPNLMEVTNDRAHVFLDQGN